MDKKILVIQGSDTKTMTLPMVCAKFNLTANKLNALIESGEQYNGVYFDEALEPQKEG